MSAHCKSKVVLPCECGHNRWKTKGDVDYAFASEYECRKCGKIRSVSKKESL